MRKKTKAMVGILMAVAMVLSNIQPVFATEPVETETVVETGTEQSSETETSAAETSVAETERTQAETETATESSESETAPLKQQSGRQPRQQAGGGSELTIPGKDSVTGIYEAATDTANFARADKIGGKGQIGANDFYYSVTEPQITIAAAKVLAAVVVSGYVEGTMTPQDVADATPDSGELADINAAIGRGQKGQFPLTFYTGDYDAGTGAGDKVTITVILTDGNADIGAIGFEYAVKDATGQQTAALTAEKAKELAVVWAKDMTGYFYTESIAVDAEQLSAINQAKHKWYAEGVHYTGAKVLDLTFDSAEGNSITIQVTLQSYTTPVTPGANVLAANDFKHDVIGGTLDQTDVTSLAAVLWTDRYGNWLEQDDITANSSELAAINEHIKAAEFGVYPLTFETPDGLKIAVQVILVGTAVMAKDVEYFTQDGVVTEAKVKELAKFSAVDPEGAAIDLADMRLGSGELERINEAINKRQEGDLEVTFLAPDGTQKKIVFKLILKKTPLKVTKVDADSNVNLAGAKLAITDEAGKEVAAWTSTTKAYELADVLIAGDVYTLKEKAAPKGYLVAKDISFTANADGSLVELVMQDEKEPSENGKTTIVKVTKYVTYEGEFRSMNHSFYAALFFDKALTQRATKVKELKLKGSYTTAVSWSSLPTGTYYLAETDVTGAPVDTSRADVLFTNKIENQVVKLTNSNRTVSSIIFNEIKQEGSDSLLPDDGKITIHKTVVEDKKEKAVKDTFYFALFSEAALENVVHMESLKLNQESSGTITFSGLAYGTYYIAETDKKGNPVGDDFAYTVSVDQASATLSKANKSKSIKIENKLEKDAGKDKNDPPKKTVTKTPTRIVTAKGVKTGDTTQSLFFVMAMLGAVLVMSGVVYQRKRLRR